MHDAPSPAVFLFSFGALGGSPQELRSPQIRNNAPLFHHRQTGDYEHQAIEGEFPENTACGVARYASSKEWVESTLSDEGHEVLVEVCYFVCDPSLAT